jgi:eukaryotic-like serine/threonine-protein kinase
MKPGTEIGHYVLAELLNEGGMGQVWLAHREFEGGGRSAVAIKFPHAEGVDDSDVRDSLRDEALLQMQMQHSNIPRVIDMGVHEGLPYFVMNFIAGHTLAQLLARLRDIGTRLRFELVAHIAREIGYALRYAHGCEIDGVVRQVIHRDVAPKNVLISGQGAVYVLDFGVAEAAGLHSSPSHIEGTLLYMAPEHALGFPTPESDGWGLGAIMWEMIEGRQFRAEVEADELRRAANEGRHEPLTRAGIPEALRFVTEGLLRVDERARLTLDEVLRPLETPEFPVQRTALADLLERCFGGLVHPAGQMLPVGGARPIPRAVSQDDEDDDGAPTDAQATGTEPTSDATIATAVDDATSNEPAGEGDLLPPPPVWGSMGEPVAAHTEPAKPAKPRALDIAAVKDPEPVERGASQASASTDQQPPLAADPITPALVPAASSRPIELVPAVPPRKGWAPAARVAVVGLVCAGIGWAVWPSGTDPEASPPSAAVETPTVVVSPVQPVVEAEPSDREPEVGPPYVEPAIVAPTRAIPEAEPVELPIALEPAVGPAHEPKPPTTQKAGSKPPRKQTESRQPTQLKISLLLFADMDVEINGVHFSLGVRKSTAKTSVTSGKVRVRWRRPLGKWKSKTFPVEPGMSYELLIDDRNAALKPLKKKAP